MARILSLLILLAVAANAWGEDWGRFEPAEPTVRLMQDGRKLRLMEDFTYIDAGGTRWVAPRRSEIDGASIPRFFWSLIGGPLEGQYRNASIIHDVYCADENLRKQHDSADVHHVFYCAMRCGGVGESKAAAMYWAVWKYGPSWRRMAGFIANGDPADLPAPEAQPLEELPETRAERRELAEWAKSYFESHPNLTPEQIQEVEAFKQP